MTISILQIENQYLDLLKEAARTVEPIEACAMLFGKIKDEEIVVKKIALATNKLHSEKRFEIDPEAVAEALTEAEREGLEFVGLFHSHSAPASPSPLDIEFMRLWGDAIWLILSLRDGQIGAYKIENGKVIDVIINCLKAKS